MIDSQFVGGSWRPPLGSAPLIPNAQIMLLRPPSSRFCAVSLPLRIPFLPFMSLAQVSRSHVGIGCSLFCKRYLCLTSLFVPIMFLGWAIGSSSVSVCRSLTDKKSSFPSFLAHSLFLKCCLTHEGSVPVYTKGSRTGIAVGFGVVFSSLCRGSSLPKEASVFILELSAI